MRYALTLVFIAALAGAETVDSVVAIVADQPIKHSDVLRDIALTSFMNKTGAVFNEEEKKASVNRLVDQMIIRREIARGDYGVAPSSGIEPLWKQIQERYGSDTAVRTALASHGLTEVNVRSQLLWQLTALTFIETRFGNRPVFSDEAPPELDDRDEFVAWLESQRKQERISIRWERLK